MKRTICTTLICVFLMTCFSLLPVIASETAAPEVETAECTTAPQYAEDTSAAECSEAIDDTSVQAENRLNVDFSTEIICGLIAFAGVIISSLISKSVSKNTAEKEIEKMKLTWEHEDLVTSEDEFGEMAASVARYASSYRELEHRDALAKIAAVRAKESADLADVLDELYHSVSERNYRAVNDRLTKVIETRRNIKQRHLEDSGKKSAD